MMPCNASLAPFCPLNPGWGLGGKGGVWKQAPSPEADTTPIPHSQQPRSDDPDCKSVNGEGEEI